MICSVNQPVPPLTHTIGLVVAVVWWWVCTSRTSHARVFPCQSIFPPLPCDCCRSWFFCCSFKLYLLDNTWLFAYLISSDGFPTCTPEMKLRSVFRTRNAFGVGISVGISSTKSTGKQMYTKANMLVRKCVSHCISYSCLDCRFLFCILFQLCHVNHVISAWLRRISLAVGHSGHSSLYWWEPKKRVWKHQPGDMKRPEILYSPVPLQYCAACLGLSGNVYQRTHPLLQALGITCPLQSQQGKSRYRIMPTEKLEQVSSIVWFNVVGDSHFYKLKCNRLRYVRHRLSFFLEGLMEMCVMFIVVWDAVSNFEQQDKSWWLGARTAVIAGFNKSSAGTISLR